MLLLLRFAPYIAAALVGAFLGYQAGKPVGHRAGYAEGKRDTIALVNQQISKTEGMISDEAKNAVAAARRAAADAARRMCEQRTDDPSACAQR